jgi:hypothetical protein
MKLLCVSDQIDPLVYSATAKKRFADVSAVLCAGDLPMDYIDFIVSTLNKPTYFVFGNHNLKEFRYYQKERLASVYPGQNSSSGSELAYLKHHHGAQNAGFKMFADYNLLMEDPATGRETPLLIAGIPGSRRYNAGLNQYSDAYIKYRLRMMIPRLISNKIRYGRYLDILLTHATPRHIHDLEDPCHKGFESFNWFIQKYQPSYLVHGHIHLYDARIPRITEIGRTSVVNAFGYHIIELPKPIEEQSKDGENSCRH